MPETWCFAPGAAGHRPRWYPVERARGASPPDCPLPAPASSGRRPAKGTADTPAGALARSLAANIHIPDYALSSARPWALAPTSGRLPGSAGFQPAASWRKRRYEPLPRPRMPALPGRPGPWQAQRPGPFISFPDWACEYQSFLFRIATTIPARTSHVRLSLQWNHRQPARRGGRRVDARARRLSFFGRAGCRSARCGSGMRHLPRVRGRAR